MSPMDVELPQTMTKTKLEVRAHLSVPNMGNSPSRVLLNEDAFVSMLYLERRRAERSQKRFVLVLVDVQKALSSGHKDRVVPALSKALAESTRETDIMGWYLENNLMGIIGTELGEATNEIIQDCFLSKLRKVFGSNLVQKTVREFLYRSTFSRKRNGKIRTITPQTLRSIRKCKSGKKAKESLSP